MLFNLSGTIHEVVAPSKPSAIILHLAELLMLAVISVKRSEALTAVLSPLLYLARNSLSHFNNDNLTRNYAQLKPNSRLSLDYCSILPRFEHFN